jgi:Uma2 family endonuclease
MWLAKLAALKKTSAMQATQKVASLSVADYLAGELEGQVRHEFLGGVVYAMAGASDVHNLLSLNLAFALRTHLRGGRCQVYVVDVKVQLQISDEPVFYYPDVMVACDARDVAPYFKRFPQLLVEVLSPETEAIDRREKFLSYRQIETLQEYVLVAQDKMEITVFRRANQWQPEIFSQPEELLRLPSLEFTLPLASVYEGIKL